MDEFVTLALRTVFVSSEATAGNEEGPLVALIVGALLLLIIEEFCKGVEEVIGHR
jgi:hypothetical protein